jgi:hypothetical protein
MGHVTGCYTVYNLTPQPFLIVKGEWPTTTLFVKGGDNRTFHGESIPWCADPREVRDKAFRLFRDATEAGGGVGAFDPLSRDSFLGAMPPVVFRSCRVCQSSRSETVIVMDGT